MAVGDVGAVAQLLNTVLTWLFDPAGYSKLTREAKLAKLMEALKVALDNGAYDAADLVFTELRRLSKETGP